MQPRLILFIDAQNMYMGARRTFFDEDASRTSGQFDPLKMGELIAQRDSDHGMRQLEQVRVYTGQPAQARDKRGYAANRSQVSRWRNKGVHVETRPLRYPEGFPHEKAQEKGIDVKLAIDFVALAVQGMFDVGVIASTDTDLKPAMEFVCEWNGGQCIVETAAWFTREQQCPRLSISQFNTQCHWLGPDDYQAIRDTKDYAPRF